MSVRRVLIVLAAVGMLTLGPAGTALARDADGGTLSCPAGRVVWITERTSAGVTSISWSTGSRQLLKPGLVDQPHPHRAARDLVAGEHHRSDGP